VHHRHARPPSAIGLWTSGEDVAVVVLTASGQRRFISSIGGVFSTNTTGLFEIVVPSLIP
jgi:hypothetical protein